MKKPGTVLTAMLSKSDVSLDDFMSSVLQKNSYHKRSEQQRNAILSAFVLLLQAVLFPHSHQPPSAQLSALLVRIMHL